MSDELILEGKFGQPYLLNDDDDKKIELSFSIMPANDLRERLSINNDDGVEICIVLDVSESMYDFIDNFNEESKTYNNMSKIDVAIREIEALIDILRDKDMLSLVVYDEEANIVFESIRGFDKDIMMSELKNINGNGVNTNISAGLREGRKILTKQIDNDKVKRIIFITDGVPYGSDSEADVIFEANLLAQESIIIDCFGIGEEFNYDLLEKIAASSNGKTSIINGEKNDNFSSVFQRTKEVIITNAKCTLKLSKLVTIEELYRGSPQNLYIENIETNEYREVVINMGDIEKNQKYTYYLKLNIPSQTGYIGPLRIAEIEMEYCIPRVYGSRKRSRNQNLVVQFGDDIESVTTNGDVKNGYKMAYVKMLENEIENAQKFNDYITIIRRYNQIMKIYKELDFDKEFEVYTNVFEEYKKNGVVTKKISNEAKDYSSNAVEKGVLTQAIPKGFIRHAKRRGGI